MDVFKLKKSMLVVKGCHIAYPVLAIGGIVALLVFADFGLTEQGPLIILGLVGWLIYEIYRFLQVANFQVKIQDDGIQVGREDRVQWNKIQKARLNGLRFGLDPVIILHTQEGKAVKIPAAIDGLAYITAAVEKNVQNIEREGQ